MSIKITELHYLLMSREGFTKEEADDIINEAKKLVKKGYNPEELFLDINIDPSYLIGIF